MTAPREIKFRAWCPIWKRMYFSEEAGKAKPGFKMALTMDGQITGMMSAQDFILMQFTGLLDKNGKEIYEGDILEHQYRDKGPVIYEAPAFRVVGDHTDIYLGHTAEKHRKVIGNVHENPELLK